MQFCSLSEVIWIDGQMPEALHLQHRGGPKEYIIHHRVKIDQHSSLLSLCDWYQLDVITLYICIQHTAYTVGKAFHHFFEDCLCLFQQTCLLLLALGCICEAKVPRALHCLDVAFALTHTHTYTHATLATLHQSQQPRSFQPLPSTCVLRHLQIFAVYTCLSQ